MPWMLMMSSTQFLIQDCEFVSSKAIEFLEKRASSAELDQYEIRERIHRYFQPIQVPIPRQILNPVNLSVIDSIATEKNKTDGRIINFPAKYPNGFKRYFSSIPILNITWVI